MFSSEQSSDTDIFKVENMSMLSFQNPLIVIFILLVLVALSGIFSGLTLGLMSLDESFLNLLLNCREQIQNEIKLLLKKLDKDQKKKNKDNFDILDEIEEERVVEWLNELDNQFKEDNEDEIEKIIKNIYNLKAIKKEDIRSKKFSTEEVKKNNSEDNKAEKSNETKEDDKDKIQLEEDIRKELKHYVETYWQGRQAESILPVRKNGNFLLVVILIGNVIVNNVISILMAGVFSGLYGLLLSTTFIVIFGEIIPQALCNKYSLYVGHLLSEPVKLLLCLFQVVAKPISLLVDLLVGVDIKESQTRNQMQALIKRSKGLLEDEEKKIIQGVLELRNITVSSVMRTIESDEHSAYLIDGKRVIDADFIKEIYTQGYSRIPVQKDETSNIIGIFQAKDLLLIDNESIQTVEEQMENFNRTKLECNEQDSLFQVLSSMKQNSVHIALIKGCSNFSKLNRKSSFDLENNTYNSNNDDARSNSLNKKDSMKILGLITMEDIIEKVIGQEIFDEKDDKEINKKIYKLFEMEHLETINEFKDHETLMIASFLIEHSRFFEFMSIKEIQEMLSHCDIINFKEDQSNNCNTNTYQNISVLRENQQIPNNHQSNKKQSKDPNSNDSISLNKLIKKPQGMNGNYYEMNCTDYLVKKDKRIDSAFLVLKGSVRVCIGNDEIEKLFKKFEIINIKLIQSLQEAQTMSKSQNEFNKQLGKKNKPDFQAIGNPDSSVIRIPLSEYQKLLRNKKKFQDQANVMESMRIDIDNNNNVDETIVKEHNSQTLNFDEIEMEIPENYFSDKFMIDQELDAMFIPNLDQIEGENKYKSQIRRGNFNYEPLEKR